MYGEEDLVTPPPSLAVVTLEGEELKVVAAQTNQTNKIRVTRHTDNMLSIFDRSTNKTNTAPS